MAIKKQPTKNVIITNTTVLWELGGIRGPILSPSPLPINDIYTLISNGINVYEVDPNNSKNKIKLDRTNYNKTNFTVKKKIEVEKTTPIINQSLETKVESSTNEEISSSTNNTNDYKNSKKDKRK